MNPKPASMFAFSATGIDSHMIFAAVDEARRPRQARQGATPRSSDAVHKFSEAAALDVRATCRCAIRACRSPEPSILGLPSSPASLKTVPAAPVGKARHTASGE